MNIHHAICAALCLAWAATVHATDLSGTVTDASGNRIAGVWVGLVQYITVTDTGKSIFDDHTPRSYRLVKCATLTASDGSWSLGGISGITSRNQVSVAPTHHLAVKNGHLSISFGGIDIAGRTSAGAMTKSGVSTSAARASNASPKDTVFSPDTLYFVRDADTVCRPIAVDAFKGGTVVVDTIDSRAYSLSGNTLAIQSPVDAEVYCSGSTLLLDPMAGSWTNQHLTWTTDGFEILRYTKSDSGYQLISKYKRLSGASGSLIGSFREVGSVMRPVAGKVFSDSVTRISAEDSALSAAHISMWHVVDTFDGQKMTKSFSAPPFASEFMDDWVGDLDSAKYNISVIVVDTNTVRLTGNVTNEIVTITGAYSKSERSYDRTYSSSDRSHSTMTTYANPTSCPNSDPDWYNPFLSANVRSTSTVAGRIGGSRREPTE